VSKLVIPAVLLDLRARPICQIKYTVPAMAITESWMCVHLLKGPSSGSMYTR
jgi:hypothetical protein